jgi:VRR-NUC domain
VRREHARSAKADATRLRAQGLGVVAGVPDIIAVRSGQMYCLELKAPGGKLTDNQRATHSAMITAGAQVATADNLDDALALLEGWGLLRGWRALNAMGNAIDAVDAIGAIE